MLQNRKFFSGTYNRGDTFVCVSMFIYVYMSVCICVYLYIVKYD